jgi:surface protein
MSMINTRYVEQIESIFSGCDSLISLDISNFDLYKIGSFSFLSGLKTLKYLNLTNVKTYRADLSSSFYNLYSLISIDLTNLDISSAVYLQNLFDNCLSLESVDLSNLNTKKVRDMRYLFRNCNKLQFVNFSNLDTSHVEYMDYMFSNCHSLVSLDLSNLDTSSVKSMEGMFSNCYNLEYVNMKNISTKSTIKMTKMFYKCSNLKYINFYSINKNVENITDIFSESSENFTYCIKDETKIMSIFQKLLLLNDTIRDCTSHCYNYDMILIPEETKCVINCSLFEEKRYSFNYECYESCPKRSYLLEGFTCEELICENFYDYEQKNCIDEIPEGYFLNDTELQTIDMCHPDCKTCDQKESENNTNCLSCFEEKYLLYGNCVSHCERGFLLIKKTMI